MNYLFSYPRSGNSYFRYIVEFLSKRPTLDCFGVADKSLNDLYKFDDSVNDKEPILRKVHKFGDLSVATKNDSVVLIIRDFIECFESNVKRGVSDSFEAIAKQMLDNIVWFHNFTGNKMIVYYEDMKDESKIRDILSEVCIFLNIPNNQIDSFIENLEYHRGKSLEGYAKINSQFTGNSNKNHKQDLSIEEIHRRISVVENMNNEIFNIYLRRYQ